MKQVSVLLVFSFLLFSCKNEYDAKYAAKEYCACMKENGAPSQYIYASKICNARLVEKNRYYRLFAIDLGNKRLYENLSKETVDSAKRFALNFADEIHAECCYELLQCTKDSIK